MLGLCVPSKRFWDVDADGRPYQPVFHKSGKITACHCPIRDAQRAPPCICILEPWPYDAAVDVIHSLLDSFTNTFSVGQNKGPLQLGSLPPKASICAAMQDSTVGRVSYHSSDANVDAGLDQFFDFQAYETKDIS
jgi:hypothetical protein